MKVSKNSWHYRMLSYFPWEIHGRLYPVSLCNYFWTVVWTFIFCLVVVPIWAVAVIGVVAFCIWILLYPILQFWISQGPEFAILGGVIDIILLLFIWCEYRKEYVYDDKCAQVASLTAQYISAKHRKICPLLEFE